MAIYPSDSVICFYTTGPRTIITRKWSSFSSKQSIGSKLASDSQLERLLLSSRITMRANSAINCPYQSPLKLNSKANVFIENALCRRLAEEQIHSQSAVFTRLESLSCYYSDLWKNVTYFPVRFSPIARCVNRF